MRERLTWRAVSMVMLIAGLVFARLCTADGVLSGRLEEKPLKSLGALSGSIQDMVLSPDGDRLACIKRETSSSRVVCNGKEERLYQFLYRETVCFSLDGSHLAYRAARDGVNYVICDGAEKRIVWTSGFAFSPDGKHFAYGEPAEGGKTAMLRDGKTVEEGYNIRQPVFSPDGGKLAYRCGHPRERIVVNGTKGPLFDSVSNPVFSPNSRQVAYAACTKEKWYLVNGRARLGPYDEIGEIVFAPDSVRLACRARVGDGWFVTCGKGKEAVFPVVRLPVFSPAGKRMAYAAADAGSWYVICDGEKSAAFDEVGDPVFSSDGKHMAFRALRDGKAFVVCDGKELGEYGSIDWVGFSSDAKHLALSACRGRACFAVVDGLEGPAHDQVLVPQRFDRENKKMRYVAINAGEATQVEVDWPDDQTVDKWLAQAKGSASRIAESSLRQILSLR